MQKRGKEQVSPEEKGSDPTPSDTNIMFTLETCQNCQGEKKTNKHKKPELIMKNMASNSDNCNYSAREAKIM